MGIATRLTLATIVLCVALFGSWPAAQTQGQKEEFSATAIANDELGSGAGRLQIRITRWSTDAERTRLFETLKTKGSRAALEMLQDNRSVGTIKTPDTLAYDLRFAHQAKTADGGRRIMIATDRPVGFWEDWHRARTTEYPFLVVQMQFGPEGRGSGTLADFAKLRAYANTLELETFTIAPIMLKDIEARPID
jgi:hypothetical protein